MSDLLTTRPEGLDEDLTTDVGPIHIRPISGDDNAALVAFHEQLSPTSQYLRFFNAHPHLSAAEVERFTHVDYCDRMALVAECEGEIVGVGRYDRLDASTEAEVAFVVADAYQGHGLATALLHRLAEAAVPRGITTFTAETLLQNHRMQAVFRHSGYKVASRFGDGIVYVRFPIGDPTQ
jgi:GNAT superfamily N-acetyltransferase